MDTEHIAPEFAHSEQINEIAVALAKAQAEVRGAVKDSENPHFRSKYADLAAVIAACRDALTKHGISVVQSPGRHGSDVSLTTLLMHSSGQWLKGHCWVPPAKLDAQGFGSVTSYLRRYTLAAMVGVASEDDDGESAVNRGSAKRETKATPEPKITQAEAELLAKAIIDADKSIETACKKMKVARLVDLTTSQCAALYDLLKKPEDTARGTAA